MVSSLKEFPTSFAGEAQMLCWWFKVAGQVDRHWSAGRSTPRSGIRVLLVSAGEEKEKCLGEPLMNYANQDVCGKGGDFWGDMERRTFDNLIP